MVGVAYEHMVLVDTSAVVALHDPAAKHHDVALEFYNASQDTRWFAVNVTAHEAFTRGRYDSGLGRALQHFYFLRAQPVRPLPFTEADEARAIALLKKYGEHRLSFHDALCAAIMKRESIYRVFSFDKDFWIMGFEMVPGCG